MWWNLSEILCYQRNFNFISSIRKIGKTYTLLEWFIKRALTKGHQFMYLCRTIEEKKKGVLKGAFEKVIAEQYPLYQFSFSPEAMYLHVNDNKVLIGHCVALAESNKIKRFTYPYVKYMILDEYALPKKDENKYINGWSEPFNLLMIYQTVDAGRDEVIFFGLANNFTFYNPYHMYPAFNIPVIKNGEIWVSENVLFQRAVISPKLKEIRSKSRFERMIEGTDYGDHASNGDFIDDTEDFIAKRSGKCRYVFTIIYKNNSFGVWSEMNRGYIYLSEDIDKSCQLIYALTQEDHKENTLLTKSKNVACLKWLSRNFKLGNVRFTSAEVKARAWNALRLIL